LIYLGIDEFSIGKNHDYMTIFIDLDTAQIIHAVEGRSKKVIVPFLKKVAKKATNLKAVSMDMSGPYKSAVKELLPGLDIVFDRFHVMKLMNKDSTRSIRVFGQNRCICSFATSTPSSLSWSVCA
jgi:transposase